MTMILQSFVQTLINFKIFEDFLKFLSLKLTTYFGQYGHHQVLKYVYLMRKALLFVVSAITCVGPLDPRVCSRTEHVAKKHKRKEHNALSTTQVRIRGSYICNSSSNK
jgi:hypothetical protein